MFEYRKASLEDLEKIWNRHIAENPDDVRYLRWKQEFMDRNRLQQIATFVAVVDDDPVGEVTLDYHACGYSGNRAMLADGITTGYVTALRIHKDFEGLGHVSELMEIMESYASGRGFSRLTIGVEAVESRNLAIYLHWGYNKFVMSEIDDGELVLFYAKTLSSQIT